MFLRLLLATPTVWASYDAAADVLFVEVCGHLTWRQAQVASVRVGQVARLSSYPRVLLRTQLLGGRMPPADLRLRPLLEAGLRQLGVRQLAWVCQPALASLAALGWPLDSSVALQLFNDVEQAATWLGTYRDDPQPSPDAKSSRRGARRAGPGTEWRPAAGSRGTRIKFRANCQPLVGKRPAAWGCS